MSILKRAGLAVFSIISMSAMASPGLAHEFWIAPEQWQAPAHQALKVRLLIGTNFKGFQRIYLPARFSHFDLTGPRSQRDFIGRLGDRPAGQITPQDQGLHIIRHITTAETLDYDDFEKFKTFTQNKGLVDAISQHRKRQLPETGFVEHYMRFAKSLVAIGHANGEDQVLGMAVEITAMENPYLINQDRLVLRLDRDGKPWANTQVMVLTKPMGPAADDAVIIDKYRTDGVGRVTITIRRRHMHLVDAVSLSPIDADSNKDGAVWLSRWASLTFARP